MRKLLQHAARMDNLDFQNPRNYLSYLAGMAVETGAVLALIVIAAFISWLGFIIWR